MLLFVVLVSVTITAYLSIHFLFLRRSSSNAVEILRVDKDFEFAWAWADVYIEGKWQEVHYYTFHFQVDIKNSKDVDVSDLRLVVELELKSKIVDSGTRIIGTLRAGESRTVKVDLRGVPHVYLYDDEGNSRGIKGVVTLYSGNEVLDRETVT